MQGLTITQSCRRLGGAGADVLTLANQVRALKEDEAQPLKVLEQENSRLKEIVAEQALDISILKDCNRETARRDAVRFLAGRRHASERRA